MKGVINCNISADPFLYLGSVKLKKSISYLHIFSKWIKDQCPIVSLKKDPFDLFSFSFEDLDEREKEELFNIRLRWDKKEIGEDRELWVPQEHQIFISST